MADTANTVSREPIANPEGRSDHKIGGSDSEAALIALGREFDRCRAEEDAIADLVKDDESNAADDVIAAAVRRTHQIADAIGKSEARTLSGLRVKVRAYRWCSDDVEPGPEDLPATDDRIKASITRDLVNLDRRLTTAGSLVADQLSADDISFPDSGSGASQTTATGASPPDAVSTVSAERALYAQRKMADALGLADGLRQLAQCNKDRDIDAVIALADAVYEAIGHASEAQEMVGSAFRQPLG